MYMNGVYCNAMRLGLWYVGRVVVLKEKGSVRPGPGPLGFSND